MLLSATLTDTALEAALQRDGFVHIPALMDAYEVQRMRDLYLRHHRVREEPKGMWNSLYDLAWEDGQKVSEELLSILKPRFDMLFVSYHTPVATFMSKNANSNSITALHRDFSIIDEGRFQYRNIWIPLIDTTPFNGALYALKASHRVFQYPFPFFAEWPYGYLVNDLFPLVESIAAKAGDCVIYADKTLHGSPINQSSDSRPAVHLGALHPDIELMFYYLDKGRKEVRTYDVPSDFYFKNDFSEPVGKYPLKSSFAYAPPALQAVDVIRQLKEMWATEGSGVI